MSDDIWFEGPEYFLAAALVAVAVLAGTLYVVQNPAAPWQLEAAYSGVFSAAAGEVSENTTLRLPVEDAAYLNRAYEELNTREGDGVGEQAYCLSLVGNRLSVQQAGTLTASEDKVSFSPANCRLPNGVVGYLHFHPKYGDPVLSGPDTAVDERFNDKRTLLDSDVRLSCVQAGLVPEKDGAEPAALKCYLPPESGYVGDTFPEVPVNVIK